jgi:hypothetical protein
MKDDITIIAQLSGALNGCVKHTTEQVWSATITENHRPKTISKKILHTDRSTSPCTRVTKVSVIVVSRWLTEPGATRIDLKTWKKLSDTQKIQAYVNLFDEGYGVSWQ